MIPQTYAVLRASVCWLFMTHVTPNFQTRTRDTQFLNQIDAPDTIQ